MDTEITQIVELLTCLSCEDIALYIVENYLMCKKCRCSLHFFFDNKCNCDKYRDPLCLNWEDKYLGWC